MFLHCRLGSCPKKYFNWIDFKSSIKRLRLYFIMIQFFLVIVFIFVRVIHLCGLYYDDPNIFPFLDDILDHVSSSNTAQNWTIITKVNTNMSNNLCILLMTKPADVYRQLCSTKASIIRCWNSYYNILKVITNHRKEVSTNDVPAFCCRIC